MPSIFSDPEHPDTSLADWEKFRRGFSPFLVDAVIDRSSTSLPDWFVPLARGVGLASSALLRQAGYRPGVEICPAGRVVPYLNGCGCLLEIDGDNTLASEKYGNLWTVEWYNHDRQTNHVLVHSFGSTPVLTRSCEEASYLAVACQGGQGHSLRWINARPINFQNAIDFAKKRRTDEALALPISSSASTQNRWPSESVP